jgi:putative toxin-antitoxin system antitoxin component (TIGR02293 family)
MSTAKTTHTEDTHTEGGEGPRPDPSRILVKTLQQGKEAQVHRLMVQTPEVTKSHAGLVTHALYGRVKKDYKPVEDIRKGLPASSVLHLAKSLHTTENYLLPIIGISDRTLQRRRKEKKPLDPVESDRVYRLAKVYARAHEVFEDEEVALDWLKSRNRALGEVPLMLLDTEAGTDLVERVLTRIEHGVYS